MFSREQKGFFFAKLIVIGLLIFFWFHPEMSVTIHNSPWSKEERRSGAESFVNFAMYFPLIAIGIYVFGVIVKGIGKRRGGG